jgi:hypothetical protein
VSIKISRILHAGYIFENEKVSILFDPIFETPFSRNCFAFPPVKFDIESIKTLKFDAVFISHFHDDHCSLESLKMLDRRTPIYMFCNHEELFNLIRELGFTQVFPLSLNSMIEVGPFKVTVYPSLDREVDSIFQINIGDLNILNVVDSWMAPETLDALIKNKVWHLVLWPFQTMREIEVLSPSRYRGVTPEWPIEWIEQLKLLNPLRIVPSSCQFLQEEWSWYNDFYFPISYQYFEELMKAVLPETKTVRMNPGTSFQMELNKFTPDRPLSWVHLEGNQNVDYAFNKDLRAPSTAEVSQNFKSLTEVEARFVMKYCETELVRKYKDLNQFESEYFALARIWRLSIFDHIGKTWKFYFKVGAGDIEQIDEVEEKKLDWTTEIPIQKFYSALTDGESLTSMYVRINDEIFRPSIEEQLRTVDFLEDPLVRSLFSTDAISFQRAQLKKIKKQLKAKC